MDHVFVLYDRASDSVWYPVGENLEATSGRSKGRSMRFLDEPAPIALGTWLEAHPNSTVLLPSEADVRALNRPVLGLRMEEGEGGVRVRRVVEGSPAASAGFEVGDLLRSIDGKPIASREAMGPIIDGLEAGDTIDVVVERAGKTLTLRPTLAHR